MKDTLTEMKTNLQGINSRMDKAENQISDLEYEEVKSNQSRQQEEKRIEKNEDNVRNLWDQHSHQGGPRRRRERAKQLEIYLKK